MVAVVVVAAAAMVKAAVIAVVRTMIMPITASATASKRALLAQEVVVRFEADPNGTSSARPWHWLPYPIYTNTIVERPQF